MKLPKKTYGPIYLPIETIVRELDAKCLIAAGAINRGYSVIIGEKIAVTKFAKKIGQGVILGVGGQPDRIENHIISLKKSGLIVTNLHEEGLVFPNDEYYIKSAINSGKVFDHMDAVFSWGRHQNQIISKFLSGKKTKSIITGNPRFDLLQNPYQIYFKKEISEIIKKYNRFILVNTNFGAGNQAKFYKLQSILDQKKKYGMIISENDETYYLDCEKYYKNLYILYVEMVKKLAKIFCDIQIVVRPHPSEEHSTWRSDLAECSNIHVVAEGSVVKWILASQVIIHTGCTTGIEAFVAGRPVLRYNPIYNPEFESELANSIGEDFSDISSLSERIQQILISKDNYRPDPIQLKILNEHISNLYGNYSYNQILDTFDELIGSEEKKGKIDFMSNDFGLLKHIENRTIHMARKYEGFFSNFMSKTHLEKMTKRTQKFSGLSSTDVKESIEKIYEISPDISDNPFEVKEIAPDIILVYPL